MQLAWDFSPGHVKCVGTTLLQLLACLRDILAFGYCSDTLEKEPPSSHRAIQTKAGVGPLEEGHFYREINFSVPSEKSRQTLLAGTLLLWGSILFERLLAMFRGMNLSTSYGLSYVIAPWKRLVCFGLRPPWISPEAAEADHASGNWFRKLCLTTCFQLSRSRRHLV